MTREVEVDYMLDIICDHTRQGRHGFDEPERVVCRIVHRPRPELGPGQNLYGFLEWLEAIRPGDEDYPPALQTYFGEGQPLGMHDGQRWRFWCEVCDDTLPVNQTKLLPVLEILRSVGRASITLTGLAPRVGS